MYFWWKQQTFGKYRIVQMINASTVRQQHAADRKHFTYYEKQG